LEYLEGAWEPLGLSEMMLTLLRDSDDGVCTLGVLRLGPNLGDPHWQTIERPWIADPSSKPGGMAGRSCVPPGNYDLVIHDSEAHPETWALVNTTLGVTHWGPSQRSAVLIHTANTAAELRGCIAPGLIRGVRTVLRSRDAFAQVKAALPWTNGHTLEIKGP
jgi:hypothetical protein